MKNKQLLNNIINTIINIINANNRKISIDKISNLINPVTKKKIGKKDAETIYLENCVNSVKYDKFKNKNSIDSYVEKVNNKVT